MKIEQVEITKETAWEVLFEVSNKDDLYLVRFSEPKAKKADGHRKEMPPMPYAMSFKNLRNINISELVKLLNDGEGAIVRVSKES